MSTEIIIQIGETISTVIIAIIVAYIAWRQHKLDQQKFRFELFDRRMQAYEAVNEVLRITVREGRFPEDKLNDFWKARAEADFIFDSDIPVYFDEVYKNGVELNFRNNRLNCEGTQKCAENTITVSDWFTKQLTCQADKFKKYLSIKEMNNRKFERIIAKEGLLLTGVIIFGLLLVSESSFYFDFIYSNGICQLSPVERHYYVESLELSFTQLAEIILWKIKVFGFSWILLSYGFIRCIIWAIKILREKESP